MMSIAVLAACSDDLPMGPGTRAATARPQVLAAAAECAGTAGTVMNRVDLYKSTTWTRAGSPYRVKGFVRVQVGRLTMQPGVVVCVDSGSYVSATGNGLAILGHDTARVLITASNPAKGWSGLLVHGTGSLTMRNVRFEYSYVSAHSVMKATIDSTVFRSASVTMGGAPGTVLMNSVFDAGGGVDVGGTGNRVVNVTVRGGGRLSVQGKEAFVRGIRVEGSGSNGAVIYGHARDVELRNVWIDGSASTGLLVQKGATFRAVTPPRIKNGRGYPVIAPLEAIAQLYPTIASQDSVRGNWRDTIVVTGGTLRARTFWAHPALPLRVDSTIYVDSAAVLRSGYGARLAFAPNTGLVAQNTGRVLLQGSAAAPTVLTGQDPASPWNGVALTGSPTAASSLTNVLIEYASRGVDAGESHSVVVDRARFRQVGSAASLGADSRIFRTRIDSTRYAMPALELHERAIARYVRIRAAVETAIQVNASTVQLSYCDVAGSGGHAIVVMSAAPVIRGCNLVGNQGLGIALSSTAPAGGGVEQNWWGDAAGPLGPNGDGVSAGLDYTPWLTSPAATSWTP
jgi:hypothetical protein